MKGLTHGRKGLFHGMNGSISSARVVVYDVCKGTMVIKGLIMKYLMHKVCYLQGVIMVTYDVGPQRSR